MTLIWRESVDEVRNRWYHAAMYPFARGSVLLGASMALPCAPNGVDHRQDDADHEEGVPSDPLLTEDDPAHHAGQCKARKRSQPSCSSTTPHRDKQDREDSHSPRRLRHM